MTPHSQDMRGLRFQSTFSGAPLISFRQHRPGGAGPLGQQELGAWGEWQGGRADTPDQVSETRPSQLLLLVRMHFYSTRVVFPRLLL